MADTVAQLLAANNETIATSQGYTSKAACLDVIESFKKCASVAVVEDQS